MARRQAENPECISHASHSLRELIDALPSKYPGVPSFNYPDLVDRSRGLMEAWLVYDAVPAAESDGAWPAFERKMRAFAVDMANVRVTRREQANALIAAMDPSGRPLPPEIAELRVSEWAIYRKFFVGACHHGSTTPDAFDAMLAEFEDFLIDRLGLRAFRNQAALEALIDEAETP